MRRSARLFEIIQILRSAEEPVTADWIAATLEVSARTIYRDIAALQSMRTPIEGEAGIGYVMRAGYDLPPLNFNPDEVEALVVGLSLLARTGDPALRKAAQRISSKIEGLQSAAGRVFVDDRGAPSATAADMGEVRTAIRDARKLLLDYADVNGELTQRTVRPLATVYFTESTLIAAWCELRQDFRHFRIDRIKNCELLDAEFRKEAPALRALWEEKAMSEQHS